MTPTAFDRDPEVLARMSRRCRDFAHQDGREDPLYAALARHMADDRALCGLLAEAPAGQQLPVLLLAAFHDAILDPALPRSALHEYYPTVGGHRKPDEALPAALADFAAVHRDRLLGVVRTRATQTNEVGRCAVLRVTLQALMDRLGQGRATPQPVALLDFGCSAGLNLSVQSYGYEDGWDMHPAEDPRAPVVRSVWRRPPPSTLRGPRRWTVVDTLGMDPSPVDVADEAATRWLRACVWPYDAVRGERLQQALNLARERPHRLVKSDNLLQVLSNWLDGLPPGVQPVVVNTWVLAYVDAAQRQVLREGLAKAVLDRGVAWISGEAGKFAPLSQLPEPSQEEPPDITTLWT